MKEEHYILLIQKQLAGEITPQEQNHLDDWLVASADNQMVAKSIQKAWALSEGFSQEVEIDLDADFKKVEKKLGETERPQAIMRILQPNRRWLLRAAAVLLLLVVGRFAWENYTTPAVVYEVVTTSDKPSEEPIELLDGTKVWLNANTEFSYFTTPGSSERRVKLNGEAFFEVTKDAKPFIVETPSGEVTVLGTSFSVLDRVADIEVNVATGKVQLCPKGSNKSITMTANERGVFKKTEGKLIKETSPALNELAWHTQKLIFENTTLETVLLSIFNFYGTPIQIEDKALESCPVSATFDHKPIETVLETLSTLLGAEVSQSPTGGYILSGGECR